MADNLADTLFDMIQAAVPDLAVSSGDPREQLLDHLEWNYTVYDSSKESGGDADVIWLPESNKFHVALMDDGEYKFEQIFEREEIAKAADCMAKWLNAPNT